LRFSFLGCVDSTELCAYINGRNHLEITQMPFSLPYFRCFGLADKKKEAKKKDLILLLDLGRLKEGCTTLF